MAGTPATVALTKAGVIWTPREYVHDPAAGSYGLEAAHSLGVEAERVFKTLVAEVDGRLTVAVVPVTTQLSLKALAAALAGKRSAMADPAVAEKTTGYVRGGISPFGQRTTLPTVVDSSALTHATVLVSGGRRGFDVEVTPADLVRLTSALVAPIAR
jgi:Cys-tRNA(Pro)/Cys-tRNA(Cys) deacylase